MGRVTRRVTCTWWLLGLAVKVGGGGYRVTSRVTCTWWLLGLAVKVGGGGWGHPQGDMHMVAARLSCQSAIVGTVWANFCPGCMDRL